jgi:hypothetical protein
MPTKFFYKAFSLVSLLFCFFILTVVIDAQCSGVYFKTSYRRLFSERVFFDLALNKDLNGDAKIDLVGYHFADKSADVIGIYILPNDGQGGFNSQMQELPVPVNISYGAINILDFNSDGKNDVVINLEALRSVLIYQNNGSGNFSALPLTQLNNFETLLKIVDLNSDGFSDLITGVQSGQGLTTYYRAGNANGGFGGQAQIPNGIYSASADFNNDGKLDFPVISGNSPNFTLRINYNQGNGVFSLGNNAINIGSTYNIIPADFNNDGKKDLLGVAYPNSISVIRNLGGDSFSKTDYPLPPVATGNAASLGSPGIIDFNADGFLDIMTGSQAPPFYTIFTNNGAGVFTRRDYDNKINGGALGDIDGDGKTDLVGQNTFNFFNQNSRVRLFNETRITVEKGVCDKPGQTRLIDFDEDLITNRTFWRQSDGRFLYRQNIPPFADVSFFWGLSGDLPALGDFDGDGKTDHAVYRPSDGVWYIRKSADGSYIFVQFGLTTDKPVPADYDGDGKTDIAVFRPADGNWYIFNSSNGQVSTTHFGISEDKPLPADFDGDGKADLAVFRPSTGTWYYLKSSDFNFVAIKWGINTDKPVPADYDGDGRADLAVFRESEGVWYVLRSLNLQYAAVQFGISGDIPQPGDWDGNGIIDIGVYRPGTNDWYSYDSLNQFRFGAAGDTPFSSILRME